MRENQKKRLKKQLVTQIKWQCHCQINFVDRHKSHFLDLVKNKLDLTFANEQEIISLIDAKNFNEVIDWQKL